MTDPDPLTGYLPIKEACTRFNRSHRQLNRDRVKAMKLGDLKVTSHFKLRLFSGEILAGEDLTVDQLPKFRDHGKNPAWYVEKAWMEQTYGRKGNLAKKEAAAAPSQTASKAEQEGSEPLDPMLPAGHIELLQDQLEHERQQNAMLQSQLKIKDEQIREANTRAEKSHELMSQLHHLLKNTQDLFSNMQDRLLPQAEKGSRGVTDMRPLSPDDSPADTRRPRM